MHKIVSEGPKRQVHDPKSLCILRWASKTFISIVISVIKSLLSLYCMHKPLKGKSAQTHNQGPLSVSGQAPKVSFWNDISAYRFVFLYLKLCLCISNYIFISLTVSLYLKPYLCISIRNSISLTVSLHLKSYLYISNRISIYQTISHYLKSL